MAYIDDSFINPEEISTLITKENFLSLAKRVLWEQFQLHKNESYKGKIFGSIPYSIKIAKAEPLLEKFLGPNPYAT